MMHSTGAVVLLLLCRRPHPAHEHYRRRRRLREEAENEARREAKRSLVRSSYLAYIEQQQQQLMLTDDDDDAASRREAASLLQTMAESVNKWGLVRAGLQCPDMHGMDVYETKVLDFLQESPPSSVLGISGMHGLGKSTLLRLIRNAYGSTNCSFDYVLYLELGTNTGSGCCCTTEELVSTIQRAIARRIGCLGDLSSSSSSLQATLAKMISSFLRDSTFLFLLDDVRDSIDLSAIGLPMPLGHGQKVIFATRDQAICDKMGCTSNTIQIQCLEQDVAWDLFRYYVGDEIIRPNSHIEYIAKQMVAECGGLSQCLMHYWSTHVKPERREALEGRL